MPPTPSIERLSFLIEQLVPLLKKMENQNVEIQLIKSDMKHKISENDLTEFKLEVEKKDSKVKQKLVIISILEKVGIAVIIYFFTKGA